MALLCFRNFERLVAGALLMAVASNAVEQSSKDPRSVVSADSICAGKCIGSRVASLEDRLNRLQETCCSRPTVVTVIKESCIIGLASYGHDDSTKHGYVRTSGGSATEIYVPAQIDRYRGVNIFEVDLKTCTTKNRQHFDTYGIPADRVRLVNTLDWMKTGTIVVGVTADTAELNGEFQKYAGPIFSRYNMILNGLQLRGKFAFIMQKGYSRKTVFQQNPRYGESLQMKIVLRGSTVEDVTFNQI